MENIRVWSEGLVRSSSSPGDCSTVGGSLRQAGGWTIWTAANYRTGILDCIELPVGCCFPREYLDPHAIPVTAQLITKIPSGFEKYIDKTETTMSVWCIAFFIAPILNESLTIFCFLLALCQSLVKYLMLVKLILYWLNKEHVLGKGFEYAKS